MKLIISILVALTAGMVGVLGSWVQVLYAESNPFEVSFLFWFVVALFCLGVYRGAIFIEFMFQDDVTRLEDIR